MSKNLLEELLIQASTLNEVTEKRVNNNQKIVIENTMASAVRNFIQEAVGEEEINTAVNPQEQGMSPKEAAEAAKLMKEMEKLYSEEEVDAETGEPLASDEEDEEEEEEEEDYSDEDEEEDYSDEDEEDEDYSEEDEDMYGSEYTADEDEEDEDYSEEDEDMYGSEYTADEDEEEVTDMTNAEINDVMEFIENSAEDVVIQVVKHPTYNVKVSGGSKGMSKGMGSSMEDEDVELEIDETVLMEMMKGLKAEMRGKNPMKHGRGMKQEEIKDIYEDEDITLEIELDEMEGMEGLDEMELEPSQMTDPKTGKTYELKAVAENRRLKNRLNQLIAENKKLKINETKSIAALKSMIEQTKQVALVNSNLAYVSRLFTEHSTTKQEKIAILKEFDSAKTLKESEMTFKILTESLGKRTQKKTLNVNINEAVDFNKQKVVKEEKAYVNDPEQAQILRLMNYKSTL
jgi:hypothetical protein